MSNLNCIIPTKEDIKRIKKYVDVGDLTDVEIRSAIYRVTEAFPGLSADELLNNKLAEINSAIAEVKNEKMEKAAEKAAEIGRAAESESAALREAAGRNLEEAAEFIVGRVVNH